MRAAKALAGQLDQERQRLDAVRSSLARAVSVRAISSNTSVHWRSSIAETNTALSEHARRLDAMNGPSAARRGGRLARRKMGCRGAGRRGPKMAIGAICGAARDRQRILDDLREPLAEAKKIQNERGRIRARPRRSRDAGASATCGDEHAGCRITDNMTLMRDAMSIFADEHHAQMVMPTLAKMKFANEAMFGADQGHEKRREVHEHAEGDRAARRHTKSDGQRSSKKRTWSSRC
ncbi:hypothetical protein [Burkholderia multivorans]|uniref:hypothetical protein n=1 Tax=Burkholderia multivorans TaxID=87883 RepID=UPI0020165EA0|nr:hypothetical protein [Burkholderia multivorans]